MATGGEEKEGRQEAEVAGLREQFPGRCRVMSQVGQHSHVVTLQPLDRDATIKFLLKESYPDSPPDVVARSASLGAEQVRQLEQELREGAGSRLGRPMLAELLALAEAWLSQAGLKPGTTVTHVPVYLDSDKAKKKRSKNGKKKKKRGEDEDGESKLPSMRTADDVIKRIQWDDNLEQDDFLVGYLDRFRGLVEKYFSAFSWEDLASVDYTVLAIPHHRIQYFKYRGVVVWDKPSRLDLVFGSTGSKVTITDVIQDYEAFAQRQAGGAAAPPAASASPAPAASKAQSTAAPNGNTRKEASDSDDDDDDDDDSDDDGIQVTIGTTKYYTAAAQNASPSPGDEAEGAEESSFNPYWTDKLRPNHFLAFRVVDPAVRGAVQEMQDFILDHEPLYKECCVSQAELHVTLCTLGLDTPQQVEGAAQALRDLQADLQQRCPRSPLKIHGVSNFFGRVVYAKVEEDPALLEFVDYVKMCVRSAGIDIRDNHEFVPHMTIMKVSRPVTRRKGTKNVDSWLYEGYTDMHFGSQDIEGLFLCSMENERREDGFYVCPSHISLKP